MKRQSIRDVGLESYLNDTAKIHNDRNYDDFIRLLTVGDEFGDPIPKRKLARIFKVSRPTVEKWISIWREKGAES